MHTPDDTVQHPSNDAMLAAVREAISARQGELWVEHHEGPALGIVVGDSARAMVLRIAESGDPGYHAVDPAASPEPTGNYVLANGQRDEYSDRDTIEVQHLIPILTHFLANLDRWPGVTWHNDGEA
jgi:hypothetical protein